MFTWLCSCPHHPSPKLFIFPNRNSLPINQNLSRPLPHPLETTFLLFVSADLATQVTYKVKSYSIRPSVDLTT